MDQGWVVNSTLCTFIGDQGGTLKGDSFLKSSFPTNYNGLFYQAIAVELWFLIIKLSAFYHGALVRAL